MKKKCKYKASNDEHIIFIKNKIYFYEIKNVNKFKFKSIYDNNFFYYSVYDENIYIASYTEDYFNKLFIDIKGERLLKLNNLNNISKINQ